MKTSEELTKAVVNFKDGNGEAFNIVYEQSYQYLHTCVIHVMKNEDAALDMLQETYLEISRNISQLKNPEDFLNWAAVIANRKCFAYLKKQKDVLVYANDESEDDGSNLFDTLADDEAFIPEEILQDREKQSLMREIIDSLSEMQRLCIIGYYYNEQKQEEIAGELGIPVNTVKTNLSRAKAKIKDAVEELDVKKGTRLYSLAPFLLLFFGMEAEACTISAMSETLQSAASAHAKEVLAQKAVKFSAKKMVKIAAAVTGVVVLGGMAAFLVTDRQDTEETENVIEEEMDTDRSAEETAEPEQVSQEEDIQDIRDQEPAASTENADQGLESALKIPDGYEIITARDGLAIIWDTDTLLYGAITYDNEMVVPAEYNNCGTTINDDGQFFLGKDGQYRVFDKEGNVLYESMDRIEAVSDGVVFHKSETNELDEFSLKYVKLDGTVLYELDTDIYAGAGGVPFNEGKALVSDGATNIMGLDGNLTNLFGEQYPLRHPGQDNGSNGGTGLIVDAVGVDFDATYPIGVSCNGYFMERGIPYFEDSFDSYSIQTTDASEAYEFKITELATYLGMDAENVQWSFRGFSVNGGIGLNYGSIVSLRLNDGVNGAVYLIDVSKMDKRENGSGYIYELNDAMFLQQGDSIEISEEKYWLYQSEGQWGYIDHGGNVIAMYDDACAFTNGKAMVVKEGKAYYIDEDMNVTGEGIPAIAVSTCGDLFRLKTEDGVFYLEAK
ncbi:MAG: sigma-70 family RNA polymerase sigma factor [Suilimivivens sp.]